MLRESEMPPFQVDAIEFVRGVETRHFSPFGNGLTPEEARENARMEADRLSEMYRQRDGKEHIYRLTDPVRAIINQYTDHVEIGVIEMEVRGSEKEVEYA